MLSDEDLTRLLEEAANSFAVPEPVVEVPQATTPVWRRRGPRAGVAAAAVLVVGAVLLSGTSGPGASNDKGALRPQPVAGDFGGGTTGGTSGDLDVTARQPAVGDDARVVKTGTLTLVVDEGKVSATVQRLQVLVAGVRGYVADSTSEESGDHPTASLTVRVPVESFDAVRNQVRALRLKVVSETASGKDVTASYADTKAQIQSLTAARNRYLDILSRARTIAETLTVQQRVDDVQQQIDRLEGQRRLLADQSDYGTLTFNVAETVDEVFAASEPSGWSKAWRDAKHGFSSGVQRLIAGSGRTLLVLICGAALLLLGRAGWRLARRRLV